MPFVHHIKRNALRQPVSPIASTIQPTEESRRPIALSIPCTGKGVWTSHLPYPASRTASAAWMASAGVSYSAR